MGNPASEGALTPGTHSVVIDGIKQQYHVAGEGSVCIVHSGGPGVNWEYLRMPEVEAGLKLVYVEPIGTGDSGRLDDPRDYTLARYARFVDGLITHLAVGPVYFLGHSHGGFIGLCYALDHPERLAGLILYDSSPTSGPEFWQSVRQNVQQFAERHAGLPGLPDVLAGLEAFDLAASDSATDEDITRSFRRMFPIYFADYWGREREFAPLREGIRMWIDPQRGQEPTPYDVRGELANILAPALVIVGRSDRICAPQWAEVLHVGIRNSQLVVLEHSGHFGHVEEPESFAQAIRKFVR